MSRLVEEVQRFPQKALLFLIGEVGRIELDGELIHVFTIAGLGKEKSGESFPAYGSGGDLPVD